MSIIATFLGTPLNPYTRIRAAPNGCVEHGFLITAKSIASREVLINYLSNYPLLSSKRLDYLSWLEAHQLVMTRGYKSYEGTTRLASLKNEIINGLYSIGNIYVIVTTRRDSLFFFISFFLQPFLTGHLWFY